MTRLSNSDLDILDGIEIPSLGKNVQQDEVQSAASHRNQPNSSSVIDNPNRDDLGESIIPVDNADDLLTSLRESVSEVSDYDSVNNDEYSLPGMLNASGLRLSDEELDLLYKSINERIDRVKDKSKRLKDAVIMRQSLDPTVVTFDPDQDDLIKKGMVKIFGHKENTITFQHYQAAIQARKEISELQMSKQLKNVEVLFND